MSRSRTPPVPVCDEHSRQCWVDTGALSWVPAEALESLGIERYTKWHFRHADGTILERWAGATFVHVDGKRATDDVVFGEPGDLVLLGAHTLEGLNFRVDPIRKQLVDAGPAPAAAASSLPRGRFVNYKLRTTCSV